MAVYQFLAFVSSLCKHMADDQPYEGKPMSELLTTRDLANLLGLSVHTIHQRRYRGDELPPAIRFGNVIRYRSEDVERWLRAHTEADAG